MKFSIIIVNYNAKNLLKDCLNSILKYKNNYQLEIIVVDNDSSGSGLEIIKNEFSEIKLIINQENLGFAKANNLGAKNSCGDLLFFLNPDTLLKEDIFKRTVDVFESNPKVGIVAPQLVLPNGQLQPWSCGYEQKIRYLIKNKFCQNFRRSPVPDYPIARLPDCPTWVSGAALIVRKDVFGKVGGFDENFFMYFEDRDLCQRVRKIGYEIKILLEIKIIHFGGKSLASNKSRKKLYYQSQSYYWRKHYGLAVSLLLRLIRWPYKFYKLLYR